MNNGKQDGGRLFKPSYYNFFTKDKSGNGLLYNTRSGSVAYLNCTETADAECILSNSEGVYIDEDSPLDELFEEGYLVDNNTNELMDVLTNYKSSVTNNGNLHITIFPTNNCNFNCEYCFINHDDILSMSDEVYDRIYRLIKNKSECDKKIKLLEILWFGGEPLLETEKIVDFMRKAKNFCIKQGAKLISLITTNGYLLNKQTFTKLLNSGIEHFQITFDGDKETHDYYRNTKTGKPTFDIIYNNLLEIKKEFADLHFEITIRSNITKNNILSQYKFIEKLLCDFANDKRFKYSFKPVLDIKENGLKCVCSDAERKAYISKLDEYCNKELYGSINLTRALPSPISRWCNSAVKNTYIVMPDSLVYTCDSLVGRRDMSIGVLEHNGVIKFNSLYDKWFKAAFNTVNSKCIKCRLFPLCHGACVRTQLMNKHTCPYNENDIFRKMDEILLKLSNNH